VVHKTCGMVEFWVHVDPRVGIWLESAAIVKAVGGMFMPHMYPALSLLLSVAREWPAKPLMRLWPFAGESVPGPFHLVTVFPFILSGMYSALPPGDGHVVIIIFLFCWLDETFPFY
jgi:hypothetical protein